MELLTDKEREELTGALLAGQASCDPERGVENDDIERVLTWAMEVRSDHIMLQSVLKGFVNVRITRGEVAFVLSPKGVEHLVDMKKYPEAIRPAPVRVLRLVKREGEI